MKQQDEVIGVQEKIIRLLGTFGISPFSVIFTYGLDNGGL